VLDGSVTDQQGIPIPGASVRIEWSYAVEGYTSRSERTARTDDRGAFRLEGLSPTTYRVEVTAPGHRPTERSFDLTRPGLPAIFHLWREG